MQLGILKWIACIFPLLSTPYFYIKFIDWPGKLRYTCAGIILPQNKVVTFIHSKGAELIYSMAQEDFTYIICKIGSDSYLKLPDIDHLQMHFHAL